MTDLPARKNPSTMTLDELNEEIADAQDEALTAWQEAAAGVQFKGLNLMDDVLAAAEQGNVDAGRWVDARQRHRDLSDERRRRRRERTAEGVRENA